MNIRQAFTKWRKSLGNLFTHSIPGTLDLWKSSVNNTIASYIIIKRHQLSSLLSLNTPLMIISRCVCAERAASFGWYFAQHEYVCTSRLQCIRPATVARSIFICLYISFVCTWTRPHIRTTLRCFSMIPAWINNNSVRRNLWMEYIQSARSTMWRMLSMQPYFSSVRGWLLTQR